MEPVSVGLVGAGPWAELAHAPMLKSGPHTRLAGVWARRPEVAARLGVPVYERIEELFEVCEAVAFCVPPGVQADLAERAARAGKALLLEKPLADSLENAERLAGVIAETGVASQMILTMRYARATRDFLAACRSIEPLGGQAISVSGALLGGDFATPWRLERGAILDVAPHVVDLMDAALGTITAVRAHGDPLRWVGLLLEHESGAVSEVSLCQASKDEMQRFVIVGRDGLVTLGHSDDDPLDVVAEEFAQTVRQGGGHELDAQRGLHLQRVLAEAERQLLT
ncbi:putative dehydrogenase [Nonomuraea soli]|uniref:Putative dehydrogenase n=2 Tax=Nonomuraea soli TaxID=1032476 RepID=A0A7W0HN02_9ACTN|nr:Gfo/Idh/MocA family oxidoreductase [Nonomuraea soli]MBA2889315.1 putative dehydrogenase [Nonomuraea soli]